MTKQYFTENVAPILPNAPGIYRYYNGQKKIIYVGKAIDIKKRVSSYFTKNDNNSKTKKLINNIASIEYTVTNNEHDAFLLENSLIKHLKPLYNIALKDDKSYPWVVIKNEYFPRIFLTRRYIKDGSEYLGPFTYVWRVRQILELIKNTIPLRTCTLDLDPKKIARGKYKVCLEYHLGNCAGPCEGKQSLEEYNESVHQVKRLLKGHLAPIIKQLKEELKMAIDELRYEKAALIQKKIEAFADYQNQSVVVNDKLDNIDVASIIDTLDYAFVNYLTIQSGQVLHSKNITIEKKLDEEPESILSYAVSALRNQLESKSNEIVLPFEIMMEKSEIIQTVPISGDKKKLLELSFTNAAHHQNEYKKKKALVLRNQSDEDRDKVLMQMQEDLRMAKMPNNIECFDNSNFQGSYPVAAMVSFQNGMPFKKNYRHFHIKTVTGINDFASMEEIVYRRYSRVLKENDTLPDLIIIDGGKGQLSAAMKSINALSLQDKVTVVGLAKREEEIFFPNDSESIKLPYNGTTMLLIRRIRDEVHRFGITFHRDTRSKGVIKNELEEIPGIGSKIATTLLQTFHSVKKIKEQSEESLAKSIGKSKAKIVFEYYNKNE